MAVHTSSSQHHDPHHDFIAMAGFFGGIIGAIAGAGCGLVADIDQILASGAKNAASLAGVPPTLFFVGLMFGYALGACVGVCVQTIGSMECPCARNSSESKEEAVDDEAAPVMG